MRALYHQRLASCAALGLGLTFFGCEGRVSKNPSTNPTSKISTIDSSSVENPMTIAVQNEPFGKTEDDQVITAYTLTNRNGMKVTLLDRGGIITSVEVPDRTGEMANVTLAFSDSNEYLVNKPYLGGICGRYANRITNGKFSLDGKEYTLFVGAGPHSLHGGKEHFMRKLWKAETFQTDNGTGVKLSYTSPDMEEGYPGTLKTILTYTLNDNNELTLEYEATTDKPTILNLTNHAYWNLAGTPGGTILDHELTLYCDKYLPVSDSSVPTGEIAPVAGTPMDFTKPEKIGARIDQTVNGNGGYDHCYVINGKEGELRPVAKILEAKSGRVMEISSTEPGVQFYTGNYLTGTADTANAVKHGAFCLETQHFPDSPNRPEFPTTRLNPGETYRQTTVHKFSVQK